MEKKIEINSEDSYTGVWVTDSEKFREIKPDSYVRGNLLGIRAGKKMNKYAVLMEKSDEARLTAIKFAKQGNNLIARFWKNASIGLKERARNLTLSEIEASN